MSTEPLLEVQDLVKHYQSGGWLSGTRQTTYAVNGVSFSINAGETLALVGESGSGKTTVGRTILRLQEPTSGSARFLGTDLFDMPRSALRKLRRRMQIIFQDPYSTLDPRMTVGSSVAEGLEIHRIVPRADITSRVHALLEEVGLDPDDAKKYPHEFSGGQRQRIGIARALAVEPHFLVCDEPVSALDVSVQAQILNLLLDLQRDRGLTYLFIAHDLAVVRHIAHRTIVMYLGYIVEEGTTDLLLTTPRHPYTQALLSAVPDSEAAQVADRIILPGDPPSPSAIPHGCPFASRCFHPEKDQRCRSERPVLRTLGQSQVACHYATEEEA